LYNSQTPKRKKPLHVTAHSTHHTINTWGLLFLLDVADGHWDKPFHSFVITIPNPNFLKGNYEREKGGDRVRERQTERDREGERES